MGYSDFDVFKVIVDFVSALNDAFPSKRPTPLALYNRLTQHIKFTDKESIDKSIKGFKSFFEINKKFITENKLDQIQREEIIHYGESEKIYIDIQKLIYQSDAQTKEQIRRHLLTICFMIEGNKETNNPQEDLVLSEIKKVQQNNSTGKEEDFVKNLLDKAMLNAEKIDSKDPTVAIMQISQSGFIQDMISQLQTGITSGDMDVGRLVQTMQTSIQGILSSQPNTK